MSCCLSVYFLVVFKTILRGLWTFSFVGLKIVFKVLFVVLGGLLTPFVTRLTLFTSSCLAVPKSLLPLPLGLSTSGYTAVLRITHNFLIVGFLYYRWWLMFLFISTQIIFLWLNKQHGLRIKISLQWDYPKVVINSYCVWHLFCFAISAAF